MYEMSDDERREFLLTGTRTGKCAVTRKDGRPHVTPIWFVLDEDDLIFTTHHTSVKAYAIRRDSRVAVCVDEEVPPFAYVLVEGRTTVSEDLDEMLRWATEIGGRYMGPDQAEAFGRRNAVEGELLVRVTPEKILARGGIADQL
jgi:PPOX class probable F420-dependent enzyme